MPDKAFVANFGSLAHSPVAESPARTRIVLACLVFLLLVRIAKLVVFMTIFSRRSEMQGRIAL